MSFNKIILFSLFLILSSSSAYSQKDYEEGYIITNKNDTIYGQVKDRKSPPFADLYRKIRFKGNSVFPKKFGPKDILGYKKGDDIYESVWLEVSLKFFRMEYNNIPNKGEKQFMKVIRRGYLSYYQDEFMDSESDYIDTVDLFKRDDEPYFVRVTQGIFGLKKKKLAAYFNDCPALVQKIEREEFKNPIEIADFYNSWKDHH